jgi:hypothetical protein
MIFPIAQMEVRIQNGNQHQMWNFGNEKKKCKLVDGNKYATNEPILEHNSMKA